MPPPFLSDPLSTTFCHSLSIICKFKSFRGITYNLFSGLTCKYPILPKSVNFFDDVKRVIRLESHPDAATFAAQFKAAYPTLPGAEGVDALAQALCK